VAAEMISICMVSLDCWAVLEPCLRSLYDAPPWRPVEVIVVDNGSRDETVTRVTREFPAVRVIRNDANVGFTRATNQGIEASQGQYLLWLNTDTILRPGALDTLADFLESHPRAGVVGPMVLNADGTFQPQCRRGMPTPLSAFAYMSGLSRVFPRYRPLSGYMLDHLPVTEPARVTSVSGCCLLARREVWNQIGPLDTDIFGFGEDIDWCVRAAERGWEVWYWPESVIVHLKGRGGVHTHPYRKLHAIHQAMWVFFRKHQRQRYPWIVAGIVWTGVRASLLASVVRLWVSRLPRLLRLRRAAVE
jgi:GT2 family glycosyltransferase